MTEGHAGKYTEVGIKGACCWRTSNSSLHRWRPSLSGLSCSCLGGGRKMQRWIMQEWVYRVAQKVSHYQIIKKSYYIVLKPVNEIRFIRQIKVW